MARTSGKIAKRKRSKILAERRWANKSRPIASSEVEAHEPSTSQSFPQSSLESQKNQTDLSKNNNNVVSNYKQTPTQKKLEASVEEPIPQECLSESEYILISLQSLNDLFENVNCNVCSNKCVCVQTREHHGFAIKLVVKCKSCGSVMCQTFSSPRGESTAKVHNPPFDVNTKMVSTFSRFGRGHASMEHFCLGMNMNVMSHTSYYRLLASLVKDTKLFSERVLNDARKLVRQAHIAENSDLAGQNLIDLAVSYDGSWHKRGFTSNYGVGCVIDILTGLVIDFEILSKYCHACALAKNDLGDKSPEFSFWFEGHKTICEADYSGSSPAMEVEAAERLWRRSETFGFRYTTLLSDGDSKTYLHLGKIKIYGNDVQIIKEECVNHVSKRLGTGLRNVVKEWKAKKVTLGGKSAGSLKETTIVKLTNYYRGAIVANVPDTNKMKEAIYATLYHCMSTDEKPQHSKCPIGKDSWCFYNAAKAKGEKPKTHKTEIHTPLNMTVVTKIIPVYQRLASDSILARCTAGKTQNANESLHSVIWNKCPKEIFISKKKIILAVTEAVSLVNQGQYHTELARTPENSPIFGIRKILSRRRDQRRVNQRVRRSLLKEKQRRRTNRVAKIIIEEAKKQKEGETYGSGAF